MKVTCQVRVPQDPSVPVTKEKYDLDFPGGPGTRPHATGLHAAIGKEYVPFFEARQGGAMVGP